MPQIHIDIIKQAIKFEENAYEFYKKVKDLFTDENSIKLCEELMLAELRHKSLLQELYSKDLDELSKKIQNLGAYDLDFINSMTLPINFNDIKIIFKYALKKEAQSVNRYTKYLETTIDPSTKDFFTKLLKEEKKHVEMISKELERYKRLNQTKSLF